MLAKRIGLIGAGRMATALARGFVRAGIVVPESIVASDPSETARAEFSREVPGSSIVAENAAVAAEADVLILAVKPQQVEDVLRQFHGTLRGQSLIVSIAAGVTLTKLAQGLERGQRIIRVMPNTPCLIGEGASAYSLGSEATTDDGQLVSELLSAVGVAYEVPEQLLDAVTGLSGSGPAFVYSMIEAMAGGGESAGLPADLALALAARTAAGAAQMVLRTGEPPAVLRDRVTSPGGTTLAGLAELDRLGFARAVEAAVVAATRRSAELGHAGR